MVLSVKDARCRGVKSCWELSSVFQFFPLFQGTLCKFTWRSPNSYSWKEFYAFSFPQFRFVEGVVFPLFQGISPANSPGRPPPPPPISPLFQGHRFLTGAFNISSNCQLVVEANASILASQRSADWPLIRPLEWYGGGSDRRDGSPMYQAGGLGLDLLAQLPEVPLWGLCH